MISSLKAIRGGHLNTDFLSDSWTSSIYAHMKLDLNPGRRRRFYLLNTVSKSNDEKIHYWHMFYLRVCWNLNRTEKRCWRGCSIESACWRGCSIESACWRGCSIESTCWSGCSITKCYFMPLNIEISVKGWERYLVEWCPSVFYFNSMLYLSCLYLHSDSYSPLSWRDYLSFHSLSFGIDGGCDFHETKYTLSCQITSTNKLIDLHIYWALYSIGSSQSFINQNQSVDASFRKSREYRCKLQSTVMAMTSLLSNGELISPVPKVVSDQITTVLWTSIFHVAMTDLFKAANTSSVQNKFFDSIHCIASRASPFFVSCGWSLGQ